jgi:hypothetical protein
MSTQLKRAAILCMGLALFECPGGLSLADDARPPSALAAYKITTRRLPSFWQKAANDAKVLWQDAGLSIPLPDGSALWLFGDTFFGQRSPDGSPLAKGAVSSSVCRVFTDNQTLKAKYRTGNNGSVAFALPLDKKEDWSKQRIWPTAGIHLDAVSYLFFARIVLTGKGQWDFRQDAAGLARARGDSWEFERVVAPDADPPLPVTPQAVIARPDGTVCLYYLENIGRLNSGAFLAKVPANKIAEPTAYQFWCGPQAGFTPSKTANKVLLEDVWGQVSVAWNEYLGQFVMLHVGGVFTDPRSIYLRTAKEPWGPWSPKTLVMRLEGKLREGLKGLVYCPYLHPELFRQRGRIMPLTYCLIEDFANPALMEIELVRKK